MPGIWEDKRALGPVVCLRGLQSSWETGRHSRVTAGVAPEDRSVMECRGWRLLGVERQEEFAVTRRLTQPLKFYLLSWEHL